MSWEALKMMQSHPTVHKEYTNDEFIRQILQQQQQHLRWMFFRQIDILWQWLYDGNEKKIGWYGYW